MTAPAPRSARDRINGIYELGHVLYLLDAGGYAFGRADIDHVESYWTFGDFHSSSAGFVMKLRDGRRAYIDFLHWHAFEQQEDFRIQVEALTGDAQPRLPEEQQATANWSTDTAHLNRVVAA
jgi:hypothetical protein